jgi:hypothetical protein
MTALGHLRPPVIPAMTRSAVCLASCCTVALALASAAIPAEATDQSRAAEKTKGAQP